MIKYFIKVKKIAKMELSTPGEGGFKPDFCCAPRIF